MSRVVESVTRRSTLFIQVYVDVTENGEATLFFKQKKKGTQYLLALYYNTWLIIHCYRKNYKQLHRVQKKPRVHKR